MNTTLIESSTTPITSQPLAHYNPEVEQRVQQWLASGQLLAWIPILSQENFPDVPLQILQFADRHQEAMRWPIRRPEDLLALPDGITGWLLPADAEDTSVACGVWNGEVYILGVRAKHTGLEQTLRSAHVTTSRQVLATPSASYDLASAREEAFMQLPL